MIKIFILSFLFVIGLEDTVTVTAQKFEKFTAWLDSQEVDGKKIIVGWCTNNTTSSVHVKYEAVLKLKDKKEVVYSGNILTLPSSPTLLTKAIFTLTDIEFEHIRLVIANQDNEILAFDHIDAPLHIQTPLSDNQATDSLTSNKMTRNTSDFELEIDGLVLDETRSKLARDFYETFYQNWSSLQLDAKGQTIIIREMPARIGIGSSVIVEVNDKPITQLNLRPGADLMEELVGQLIVALENYLNDPSNHTIIDGNDLIGSGIY